MRRGWLVLFLASWSLACSSRLSNRPFESASSKDRERTATAHSYFELGRRFRQQGDSNRAEEYLRLALDFGYPEEQGLVVLLRVCLEAGRLRAALGYAERRLKTHPSDISLRQLVATIHMGLGNSAAAIDELAEVLDRAPETASAHYFSGIVYETAFADYASAKDHFRSYLLLEPHGPYADETTNRLRARTFEKLTNSAQPPTP